MTFKSTRVERGDDGFKVTGDLTLRGVTKPVTLDVEYAGRTKHPQLGERVGFSARGSLNRKDFGITFNQVLDAGGVALGEKVEINIEVQATRAAG
jgi:polyisoprenoid-binding protein YceI